MQFYKIYIVGSRKCFQSKLGFVQALKNVSMRAATDGDGVGERRD